MDNPKAQFFVDMLVKYNGFKKNELISLMDQIEYQPQIIESISHPYEKQTWDNYKRLFITDERIKKGLQFWYKNKKVLDTVSKRYGVPPEVIIATLGIETKYGENQGNYRVLDALGTLAFYYPKRSVFFMKELKEYLLLCREHQFLPTTPKGSYAGAIGMSQFMPSSYRAFAVDYEQKGKSDLMNDSNDAIASVANYYVKHHWIANEPIAEQAKVTGTEYKEIDTKLKTETYNVTDLIGADIVPIKATSHRPTKGGLLILHLLKSDEYWIIYHNFYVITHYNTSPQYAMAVHLLATALKEQWQLGNIGQ